MLALPSTSPLLHAPPQNLQLQDLPVGGRLHHFWESWKSLGAANAVVEMLRWGIKMEFWQMPPIVDLPILATDSNSKREIIHQEITEMINKLALEEVKPPYGKGFYSRVFVVPKPNGKWRPIIDLKRLNQYIKIPRFKMESIQTVWTQLLPGNFAFSIDLTDAYFHVPVHPSYRKYLRIFYRGKVFQFRALPFGLSTAPYLFTKIMSEVKAIVHLQGIQLFLYLDDWLVHVDTYLRGAEQSLYMTNLCQELGLLINLKKSELEPVQSFDFIGAHFNLLSERVSPKEENLIKLRDKIKPFLYSLLASAKEFQSLLGKMAAQFRFIQNARLFMRPIQWHMKLNWDQTEGDPHELISISPQVKACLKWWLKQINNPQGVPLQPPTFQTHMFTDASEKGWGAHVLSVQDIKFQGLWSTEESQMHMNRLELRAVRLALSQLSPAPGQSILISTDNTTVVAHINKQGGTHSWDLMEETACLYQLVMSNQWQIRAVHIPGRLNVIADNLSRAGQIIPTEWSLHPQAVELIFQRWFTPLIDLFATRYNSKCQTFVSPVPDMMALAVDALSLNLQGMEAYAYPPSQILPRLLQNFQKTTACSLIVIAPWWPRQSWFPRLLSLAEGKLFQLPHWKKLLKQPNSQIYHNNPEAVNLHAFWLKKQP